MQHAERVSLSSGNKEEPKFATQCVQSELISNSTLQFRASRQEPKWMDGNKFGLGEREKLVSRQFWVAV